MPLSVHPTQPVRRLLLAALTLSTPCSMVWLAQAKPNKAEVREMKRELGGDLNGGKPPKREESADSRGGRANPSEAEARALTKLRERLEVTDDAEWDIIAERIVKVNDARLALNSGAAGGRSGPGLGEKGKRSSRTGASAHPEQDALRSALTDKLPDAEIKLRLSRAHDAYQQNEARLARAQSELRSVLTVRQEAVAVMAGLLPP